MDINRDYGLISYEGEQDNIKLIIDNDKYVYSTSSNFYLDRDNPRCEIIVSHLKESYDYIIN